MLLTLYAFNPPYEVLIESDINSGVPLSLTLNVYEFYRPLGGHREFGLGAELASASADPLL